MTEGTEDDREKASEGNSDKKKSLRDSITARESESVPKTKWLLGERSETLNDKIQQRRKDKVTKK